MFEPSTLGEPVDNLSLLCLALSPVGAAYGLNRRSIHLGSAVEYPAMQFELHVLNRMAYQQQQ